jgi:UDP-GlcNAc:undecaprenyl-phosphate/decaprenyl-phosphate GlcNAc-1-phosphate transferase
LKTIFHPGLAFIAFIALSTYLLGFPVAAILRRLGLIDRPNARSSHVTPVIRGGGLAMAGGLALAALFSAPFGGIVTTAMLLGAFVIGAVSFRDDIKSVGPAIRFGCHSLAACAILFVIRISNLWEPMKGPLLLPAAAAVCLLSFLWIVGYTNAFNFMDGINGLAAGQAMVTGFGMAIIGGQALHDYQSAPVLWSLAIGSSALGFLPHNFPRARMFMGDVGSAPLGFCLAVITLWFIVDLGPWLALPLLLLHANFVLDTGITLFRRILRGERWHEPHREHFYQRLIRAGKSHSFVTRLEMGMQIGVLALMYFYLGADLPRKAALTALILLGWLAFFACSEFTFRKSLDAPAAAGNPNQRAGKEKV